MAEDAVRRRYTTRSGAKGTRRESYLTGMRQFELACSIGQLSHVSCTTVSARLEVRYECRRAGGAVDAEGRTRAVGVECVVETRGQ